VCTKVCGYGLYSLLLIESEPPDFDSCPQRFFIDPLEDILIRLLAKLGHSNTPIRRFLGSDANLGLHLVNSLTPVLPSKGSLC